MSTLVVNMEQKIGAIKPMHGVGQPPFLGIDYSHFTYLKEAHIPFSRLHDVGGPYGRFQYVDIPNIFRDFEADPSDPAAYDFSFTDGLIAALVENEVEPFFRLGVTIENWVHINAYRIYPPKDYHKWARICEGIIRHYNEGWAEGYHYNIRYWEIWNEPDNYEEVMENCMWRGTKEQFFEFYHVAATYLKEKFPHLKIGGYGSCGFGALDGSYTADAHSSPRFQYFITFFDAFLKYIKEHGSPMDFFSWHSYNGVAQNKMYAEYARRRLDEAGYTHTETTCNEWHFYPKIKGTMEHAAYNTAMLIAFQDSPLDSAMFYDARIGLSNFGGLFHPMKCTPHPLYYGFLCFGELYQLGTQIEVKTDSEQMYVCAAANDNEGGLLIVNTGEAVPLSLELAGSKVKKCSRIDEECGLVECQLPKVLDKHMILYLEIQN